VLAALPGWFGIEEAVDRYERDVADLPTFAVAATASWRSSCTPRRRRRST
jgi:hypothetical protein